jgi:hypothetical protein
MAAIREKDLELFLQARCHHDKEADMMLLSSDCDDDDDVDDRLLLIDLPHADKDLRIFSRTSLFFSC